MVADSVLGSSPPQPGVERGRFAPSPTGPLHFGSLVAAVASFLEARQRRGEWLVRIEDVDQPRTRPGATDAILRTLEQCGLCWDGPVLYQSQRTEVYRAALDGLLQSGLAYPCTCTRREVADCQRGSDGSAIYPGYCRNGPRTPTRPAAIRLRVPDTVFSFNDRVQGHYQQHVGRQVGDFVLRRTDGWFAYQLAVVVDDAAQGITQVVRGSDLLDSTPRQLYLQQVLASPTPHYAHLPVAIDSHGRKLSKQTGARPVDPENPAPVLWAVLDFLGQEPPSALRHESPVAILAWAEAAWQLRRVPALLGRPSQNFTPASGNNDAQYRNSAAEP